MTKTLNIRDQVIHPHTGKVVSITARKVEKTPGPHGREYTMYRVSGGCYFSAFDLKLA